MPTSEPGVSRRSSIGRGAALKRAVTEAHRLLDQLLAVDMAALGLTIGESDVLTVIHLADYPPVPGEIADWLGLTGAGTTGRLNTLERRGLLERHPNPSDRRSVTLHLTLQGEALAASAIDAKNTTILNTIVDYIGAEAVDQLVGGLDHVTAKAREILDNP